MIDLIEEEMNTNRSDLGRLWAIILVALSPLFTSCEEELGCTDRTADNYNADAVRDDGSCINARDKFLGVYKTLNICWPDSMPNVDTAQVRFFTISEDDLREQNDDVIIYNFGRDSVAIKALVSRDKLTIPLQEILVRGLPMSFTGVAYIDTIGRLTMHYNVKLGGTIPYYPDCVIFADRIN